MSKHSPLFIEIGPGLSMMTGTPKISSWNTEGRPKKPKRGTIGFNKETKSLELWDGSNWFKASMS